MSKQKIKCSECKKSFVPYCKKTKTCSDKECKKSRKNRVRRKAEKEFNCSVCGVSTWSSKTNAKLCGKKECLTEYRKNWRENSEDASYQKNYKEKLKFDNKKKWKPYTQKELVELVVSRYLKKTFTSISKKLKRNAGSIQDKHKKMNDNKGRFKSVFEEAEIQIEKEEERLKRKYVLSKEQKIEIHNKKLAECFERIAS